MGGEGAGAGGVVVGGTPDSDGYVSYLLYSMPIRKNTVRVTSARPRCIIYVAQAPHACSGVMIAETASGEREDRGSPDSARSNQGMCQRLKN